MLVWDIETGGLPDTELSAICPEYERPPHPGEFDPASVKVGNLGEAKAKEKVDAAREAHKLAVAGYDAACQQGAEQHFANFKANAALSATTGRVLAIGFQSADNGKFAIEDGGGDEAALLAKFWTKYRSCRAGDRPRSMVGCNIFQFDLPFVVRRSWILGVEIPDTVIRDGRFWDAMVFVDLRNVWLLGQRWNDCESSLDTMARALGCGSKNGHGAEFARLWNGTAEERNQAVAYLKNDLAMTAAVAKRLGVV